jgi:NAD(P)H-flavin reductase
MLPTWYTIRGVRRETHDTFTFDLAARHGQTEFRFQPGQFNMLYVFGVGEVPISISGDPARTDRITHTTRAVGAVTRAMRRLKRGDALGVRGPFGMPWPVDHAVDQDLVIVAGGIGLAPLRPVLYHVLQHRRRYRRVELLYGARTPDDLLYVDEFIKPAQPLDLDAEATVDAGTSNWAGRVGVVTTLIPRARFDARCAIALICGPEIMMRFTVRSLQERGLVRERIFVSLERNMKCAIGFCGHCQYGPAFVCKDGPVFRYDRIERLFGIREL